MMIIFGILNTYFGRTPIAASPMNASDVPLLGQYIFALTDPLRDAPDWTIQVWGQRHHVRADMSWIQFTAWYFLCSFSFNTLIQRMLGLHSHATGGMENMFKGASGGARDFPDI